MIPVIIALSAQKLGYSGHDLWYSSSLSFPPSTFQMYLSSNRCTIHDGSIPVISRTPTGLVISDNSDVDFWNLFLLTIPVLLIVCIGTILLLVVITLGFWVHTPCPH